MLHFVRYGTSSVSCDLLSNTMCICIAIRRTRNIFSSAISFFAKKNVSRQIQVTFYNRIVYVSYSALYNSPISCIMSAIKQMLKVYVQHGANGLRGVWGLPYRTHSALLYRISNMLPLKYELAYRALTFVHKSDVQILLWRKHSTTEHTRM